MAEYGPNLYGDELTFYGARPASDLSANPMVAKVFTHGTVDLTWPYPKMAVDSFRIVRNQTGHPIHETDGVVLLHQDTLPEGSSSRGLIDGVEHPLDVGRYAYYSAFAKLAGAWRRVGKTQVLIPGRPSKSLINRGTLEDPIFLDNSFALQTVLLDLIPRVFTNARRDSVGPHDETSALREFLTALALAPEEVRTLADLILPSASKANLPPGLLEPAFLQRGLESERGIPIIDQKRLLREAYNVASRRGTALGLTNYIESLTGWAPDITLTGNLLRYSKSSTFSGGVGEWGVWLDPSDNRLTTNQSSAETDTTGFASYGAPAATISSSSTYAYSGTKSIKSVATGDGTSYGVTTYPTKVASVVGNQYTGKVRVRTAETKSTLITLALVWWTAGDAYVSTTYSEKSAAYVTSTDGWVELSTTGIAPATGVKVALAVIRAGVGIVTGDAFYTDGLELMPGGLTSVDCSAWQPTLSDPNYVLTTAGKVEGKAGRLELPLGGWNTPNDPGFFPVKPNTEYTFSAYFRSTDQATNSVEKTLNLMARGFRRKTDTGHSKAWPDRALQDYLFGDGEWRIDDPFYWPRSLNTSFVLGTGSATWQRESLTIKTGPEENFLSFAIEWTGPSSDNWVFTGVSLEEAGSAGVYRYPNSGIVTVNPTRTNLVTNPSFPAGSTTGWTYLGGATVTSSTDIPDGVLVANSLSFQDSSPWDISTDLPEIVAPTETAITASVYLRGPSGATVTLGLDTPTLDASEASITCTPDSISIDTVTIDGGLMTVATLTDHNFDVGQSVVITGQPLINGTVTVSRVLSASSFTVVTLLPNASLDPEDCKSAVVEATVAPWRRVSTSLTLPIGTHIPTLYVKSTTTGVVKIAGVLAEKGAVTVGDYFDGDSPGQYGTEWRATPNDSVSDMYRGKVMMSVRLNDTLGDYVPRHVGVQIVTLGGTLVAEHLATA